MNTYKSHRHRTITNLIGYGTVPFNLAIRATLAVVLGFILFYIGNIRVENTSLLQPIWERDSQNLWELIGIPRELFSSKSELEYEFSLPPLSISIIGIACVAVVAIRGIFSYGSDLSLFLMFILVVDIIVFATCIRLFVYSGTFTDTMYYIAGFLAGVFIFGIRSFSRLAFYVFPILIFIGLILQDNFTPYAFWIPIIFVSYSLLRSSYSSENIVHDLQDDFNLSSTVTTVC